MKGLIKILLIALLFWHVATPVKAGTIRLQVTASVDMHSELLWAKIKITNKGDEAAVDVRPIVWIQGRSRHISGAEQLPPEGTLETEYRTDRHPFQEPGFYYLPLLVEYRDQSGSRFRLPFLVRMTLGTEKPAGLKWKTSQPILPKEDSIKITLTNTDSWSKTIHFSTIMAMGIQMELPQDFELKGKESRTWHLKIKHGTIWPNTYFSYLIAEFSHQGQHYAHRTMMKMHMSHESAQNAWLFERQLMLVVLIILVVVASVGGYGPLLYRKIWQKHS